MPHHTLLRTKLGARSPPAGVVVRPRLHAALAGALRARLTLLSAPAGFGKGTLLAGYGGLCDALEACGLVVTAPGARP